MNYDDLYELMFQLTAGQVPEEVPYFGEGSMFIDENDNVYDPTDLEIERARQDLIERVLVGEKGRSHRKGRD